MLITSNSVVPIWGSGVCIFFLFNFFGFQGSPFANDKASKVETPMCLELYIGHEEESKMNIWGPHWITWLVKLLGLSTCADNCMYRDPSPMDSCFRDPADWSNGDAFLIHGILFNSLFPICCAKHYFCFYGGQEQKIPLCLFIGFCLISSNAIVQKSLCRNKNSLVLPQTIFEMVKISTIFF